MKMKRSACPQCKRYDVRVAKLVDDVSNVEFRDCAAVYQHDLVTNGDTFELEIFRNGTLL